ncbi:MAG: transglutaminase-like domain-containing protein, partial [Verrucomicrobiota bacterium]
MIDTNLTTNKKEALFDLLDDPSPTVRKALLEEFSRLGPQGFVILKEASQTNNRILSWHARRFLAELNQTNPVEEFREFIRSLNYELETGSLLIARIAHPNLDIGDFCQQVDKLAQRCRELVVKPTSAREECLVLNRVLFHESGFRGNIENYNDPQNSFLNCVLESRKGLPISLSILYIIVAQRIGLHLDPIGIPGHFLVGCFEDDIPFYLDPFERGKFYTAQALIDRIETSDFEPEIEHLAPT